MTKWTTRNGGAWTKYKEKEIIMRINEITNSQDKLELLRMIDAAIWQAFDEENAFGDNESNADTAKDKGQITGQGVVAANTPKPVNAPRPVATPVKTLNPQQLAQMIKNFSVKPSALPTTAMPARPNINAAPSKSNKNTSFDTVNAKNDDAKNKDGESDRQV